MTTGWRSRVTPTTVGLGLVVVGLAILGLGGIVLAWDGSWFVVRSAATGMPTFEFGRAAGWLVQIPIVLTRGLTNDPAVLTVAAGLAFAAVPAGAVLASRRVTRPDRDDLLALAVIGIGLASLAGIAVLVSEAMMAVALGWPLILAAALGRLGRHRLLVTVLALILAGLHPFAVPILGLVVVAIVARTAGHPSERAGAIRVIAVLIVLVVALTVRYLVAPSGYESAALDLQRLTAHWLGGVAGAPLVAIGIAWGLGLLVVVRGRRDRVGVAVIVVVALVAGIVMIGWAIDVERWRQALMFRTYVLAASVPLFGLAILAGRRAPRAEGIRLSGVVIAAIGIVMVSVVSVQTLAWRTELDRFRAGLAMQPEGCVEADAIGIQSSPLDHWSVTSLGLVVEGRTPRHLVTLDIRCPKLDAAGGVPIRIVGGVVEERIAPEGWLDLRALANDLGGSSGPGASPPP